MTPSFFLNRVRFASRVPPPHREAAIPTPLGPDATGAANHVGAPESEGLRRAHVATRRRSVDRGVVRVRRGAPSLSPCRLGLTSPYAWLCAHARLFENAPHRR